MNTSAPVIDNRSETYLGQLKAALDGVPRSERDEILREIRAHILDSVETASNRDVAAEKVLRLLGAPQELAERYRTEYQLSRASHSLSPLFLLRTTWRWAKLGMRGILAFLLALFGYTIALSLIVAILLKPFMPSRVGMWVGSEGLNIGVPSHPERMHELLGSWFVPVIAVLAFAFAVGTTQALRWVIRKRSPRLSY